jgi:hypothetical protein
MENNLDNEKANKMFTFFCYSVLIAFSLGVFFGAFITYFYLNY